MLRLLGDHASTQLQLDADLGCGVVALVHTLAKCLACRVLQAVTKRASISSPVSWLSHIHPPFRFRNIATQDSLRDSIGVSCDVSVRVARIPDAPVGCRS